MGTTKKFLENILIPLKYNYCGDWWFWAQIFIVGKVGYSCKPMNLMRKHKSSATSINGSSEFLKFRENIKVVKLINGFLNESLVYEKKYSWIIDLWVEEFTKSDLFNKMRYLLIGLPYSFYRMF